MSPHRGGCHQEEIQGAVLKLQCLPTSFLLQCSSQDLVIVIPYTQQVCISCGKRHALQQLGQHHARAGSWWAHHMHIKTDAHEGQQFVHTIETCTDLIILTVLTDYPALCFEQSHDNRVL